MEEVLVTAQKREERLVEVPISISVLGGEALDESSLSSVNEVLRTVPGVASFEFAQGAGMTKFSVRGVTSNDSIFNGSATVGYYLDEIPFAFIRFPVSPDVNAFDLERVEVLRGPQGTLYGANALNGVVRVMTRDADLSNPDFSARTTYSSTEHGGDNYRGDVAISMPIIPEKLAVRAVGGYADYSGWIDQPFTGAKDVNDMKQKNFRLKVNAAPTEDLSVDLLSWFSRDDRGSHSTSRDDRTTPSTFPEAVESKIDAFGMTVTYDLPAARILSSTSYLDFTGSTVQDFPLGLDMTVTALKGRLLSEEVRVNSSAQGPWKWSFGGIYREENDSSLQDLLRNAIASLSGISENVYESNSYALYGEISRLFGDHWELTAGLRYFEDENTSDERRVFNPVDTPFGESKQNVDAVTPRLVLSYRPTSSTSYYASYSEGFRSGFAQNGQVLRLSRGLASEVDPDRLTNYEIGTKGSAFSGRFNYELAGYYITWDDAVQVLAVQIPGTTAFWNGAVNSKGIDGFGADAAFNVRIIDGLEFGATYSWNELGFTDSVTSGATIVYRDGDRPTSSPKTNASAYFKYGMPVAADYTIEFGSSASYTTKMPGPYAAGVRQFGEDFTLVRANVTLTAPAGWSAMLFVDNLTDEDARIHSAPLGLTGLSDRVRPRTFGLQLDYRY